MLIYYLGNHMDLTTIVRDASQKYGYETVYFSFSDNLYSDFILKKPDIFLVQVSFVHIINNIRRIDPETPIIVLSNEKKEMDKVIALDFGANDYMVMPFGMIELSSRIVAKLHGIEGHKIGYFNVFLNSNGNICKVNQKDVYLTEKEFDVLNLLIRYKRSCVSRDMIFKKVWHTDFIGETRTLDMHINSIRKKLKENKAEVHIKTRYGVGYYIEEMPNNGNIKRLNRV